MDKQKKVEAPIAITGDNQLDRVVNVTRKFDPEELMYRQTAKNRVVGGA